MDKTKTKRKQNKLVRKSRTVLTALFRYLNGPPLVSKRVFKKAWAKKNGGSGVDLNS